MRFPQTTMTSLVLTVVVMAALAGCSTTSKRPSATVSSTHSVSELPTSGIPDYQLGGAYPPAPDVTIVERDSTSRPAAGRYNICYINGFQTQGAQENAMWLKAHGSDVLRDSSGKPLHDPGWPDEMILDTTTAAKRDDIASVLGTSIDRCASRGFDAVEFDNLDSYTRFAGRLTEAGNFALARILVARAHERGLAAGQKNTPDESRRAKAAGYDFAIAEECLTYNECGSYTKVYGSRVIDIEYTDDLKGSWTSNCARPSRPAMTILRDRNLVPKGNRAYVFQHC